MPTLCLNMIVKNESKIIGRLLETVFPLIDSCCICDTGSTDNTIELIDAFFKEREKSKPVLVKFVTEPFRDFGYNRTFALRACDSMPDADYLLLLDADMILKINPELDIAAFKSSLVDADAFLLAQGSPRFYYNNVRILKNSPNNSYWGVTHEYVKTAPGSKMKPIDKDQLFINDIGDGGAKTDKTTRDIRLLKKGLEECPDNDRYTFYLANSYRDIKDYTSAIEFYKKRIAIGGWQEEVWFSYYNMGKCYLAMQDIGNAIFTWLEAYSFYPERLENLYEIIHYYRIKGQNRLAYHFWAIADEANKTKTLFDHLFLEKAVYDFKLDYEFSIIGYYHNPHKRDIMRTCLRVLSHPHADEHLQRNVLQNCKFYAPELSRLECPLQPQGRGGSPLQPQGRGGSPFKKTDFKENYEVLRSIGQSLPIDDKVFVSSTPSICYDNSPLYKGKMSTNRLFINVRFVNYRIDKKGQYINKEHIITKNVLAIIDISNLYRWKKVEEFEVLHDTQHDGRYVGLEDVRLFSQQTLMYNANRGLTETMTVENGLIDLNTHQTYFSKLLSTQNKRSTEKNWVLFKTGSDKIRMVYEWHPLSVGLVEHMRDNTNNKEKTTTELEITTKIDTPPFFRWIRGSTNGISMGDEVWFICHLVSYEDRRYYYHLFVVLDSTTYEVKRYSKLWTFEAEKVEYTLGFIYMKELQQFMIGYSTNDCTTNYMVVSKARVDELF